MNLLPIIVLFPITMALILNLLHGKERVVKYLTYFLAISLIILPFIGNYGYYYFGGHGVVDGYTTGIAYLYNSGKQALLIILSLIVSLSLITGMSERLKNNMFVVLTLMGFAGVAAIILSDDLFNLYVFFEIVSMVQAGLVFLSGTEESYKAGLRYTIIGVVAGSFMLLGIAFLLAVTGSLNISDIKNYIVDNPVVYAGLMLLIVGLAYSSGLPPFHIIKADLYSRAKGFISSILQMYSKFVLVGVFLVIIKIFSGLAVYSITQGILIFLSVLAIVFGTVLALVSKDLKRLLAYSSISHVGFASIGLALGTPLAIVAGIFHIINSVIFKAGLFIMAYVISSIRCPNLEKLGGLIDKTPLLALLTLILMLSAAGIPFLGGFQSKLLIIKEVIIYYPEIAIIMILASIGSFIYMTKAFYLIFLRPTNYEYDKIKVPKSAIFSMIVLVILTILFGVYPDIILKYLINLVD
ncbi:energy conserving hydrogenase EhbF [Methanocaldococcus indicus]|uniref:energy conserving hydrogenase EhbF n=1 Tax=Methanocaldococcus indicus TaxID=213231 RepID=UPI003C6D21D9